jgi:ZIP family zinc transporter
MRSARLAAIVTGLATGLGALPLLFVRELGRRTYDLILGVGAGLMLAAATLGLLGEALLGVRTATGVDLAALAAVTAGFLCGVGIAAAMDRFIPHRHAGGHHQHLGHGPGHDAHDRHTDLRRIYIVIGALSIHRLPEGVAIGAGFAANADSRLGWFLTTAVALQNICEGLVMGAPLRHGGFSAGRSLLVTLATGLVIPIGAFIGFAVSAAATAALPFVLALAGGTLIYVTSNEIIPESHSHGHEGTASAGLVTGFLLTMLIGAIVR